MPADLTYPGVYLEEIPSGVRTITGVSTSVTAFIGSALKGPDDRPILIQSFAEFERIYGGLWKESYLGYVIEHYFNNGGKDAVIIRVHNQATKSDYELALGTSGAKLKINSANPGSWSKNYLIQLIREDTELDPDLYLQDKTLCNLKVYEDLTPEGTNPDPDDRILVLLETYGNISLDSTKPRYIVPTIENGSDIIRVIVEGNLQNGIDDGVYESNTISKGSDGGKLTADNIVGESDPKSGLQLLQDVDIFNLLCIPSFFVEGSGPEPDVAEYARIYDEALEACKDTEAFIIVDPLISWTNKQKVIDDYNTNKFPKSKNKNMAIFFPSIKVLDTENENRPRIFPPCGAIAGVMARTDTERGVWKAPAGLDAALNGVVDLSVNLTDPENGTLNKLGINCLRTFFGGPVVWGSRTLRGDDRFADEWKYIPVRRTAQMIKRSISDGTKWVIFEPNDEKLWSQIRLNVGAFLHDLFLKGAFQGTDPRKAYYVKCGIDTTSKTDIDKGIVNIEVGVALLRPAEFVRILFQQFTQTGVNP